jgi:CTD small phosphatase-like protein 2
MQMAGGELAVISADLDEQELEPTTPDQFPTYTNDLVVQDCSMTALATRPTSDSSVERVWGVEAERTIQAPEFVGSVVLPIKTRRSPRLTVVLDLDETLIHAELMPKLGFDEVVKLENDGVPLDVFIGRRPYLLEFLTQAAELFEVVAFTASHSVYADQVMNLLDPDRRFLRYRLSREACVMQSGVFVKDLRCLGRDLRHVILVDNNPFSFMFQPYNGIPITSWFGDESDRELESLLQILIQLSRVEDVRPVLKESYSVDVSQFSAYTSSKS